jgi:hypothetical protein
MLRKLTDVAPSPKRKFRITHSKGQVLLHNIHHIGMLISIICLKSYKLLIYDTIIRSIRTVTYTPNKGSCICH